MQSVDHRGLLGEVQEYNEKDLAKLLEDSKISHVDVFKGTKENIKARKKMIGKPFKHRLIRAYKKVPSIKK